MSSVSNDDRQEPWAQWEEVTVTFGAADTDTVVPHSMDPPTPEHVQYLVSRAAPYAHVYHDESGTRTPWQSTYLVLRCNVANAQVKLLLYVGRSQPTVLFKGNGVPVVPTAAVNTNTTQAASTAFVVAQARTVPSYYAAASGDFTTSSATYVDVTGLSVTFTSVGGNVMALWSGPLYAAPGSYAIMTFAVDGVDQAVGLNAGGGGYYPGAMVFPPVALGAGSHTIKVRLKQVLGGPVSILAASVAVSYLTVVEFKG